jgi:uncharacterized protein (DUF2252 family)
MSKKQLEAIEHPTVSERASAGRAARSEVPRRDHAVWEPPPDRRSPVELLEEQAATRVPELVPLRYGRMLVSPFTFYRGAAYLMAADLSALPQTSVNTQLCGDAHLSNFGAYAAPDRMLVFDVNDFDETLPGPFEWDLKRLVTSFAVAGRDRGFDADRRKVINREVTRAYRETMHTLATMGTLEAWYLRIIVDEIMRQVAATGTAKQRKRAERNVAKTRAKGSLRALGKLTEVVDGALRIRHDPPGVVPIHELVAPELHDQLEDTLRTVMRSYRETLPGDRQRLLERFRYVDAARKVVGVGSVGTRAWITLMVGRDDQDPLFLQLKEAEASVLEPFLGASEFDNHGQRVVEGQRLTQSASDIMLGWLRTKDIDDIDRHYYVRQLWDAKGSVLVDLFSSRQMREYAALCGQTLARAHARAGDSVAIAGYVGRSDGLDRALARFAEAYADQNEHDYAIMQAAVADGTIIAENDDEQAQVKSS